jgi:superfamily II DNA/RNA helicase
MEPLTTQTFSGDEAQEPATLTGSVTALPGLTDETHAVPFRDFDIGEAICSGLEAAGIFTTFPIQALALPLALAGQDIIGQARTGTGKTLAFGVPLLQLIEEHGQSRVPSPSWSCRPGNWRSRSPTTCVSPR